MKLKPYPEYKESGVPWLGKVPGHWIQKPGMAILKEKQIKNIGLKEKTVLTLSYGKIKVKSPDKLHGLVPESFETYQIVEPFDIIIRPTDLQNDKVSLRVGKVKDKGIITSAYICMKPVNGLQPDYAHLLLHSLDLMKVFYGLGSGLRQNLSWLDFKRLPFFVPKKEEQTQIARFLDYKSSQISRFIRAKKRMIDLLKEQKQATINDAVTGKIDVRTGKPYPKYKESGVEWLGKVPEGWEIQQLKRIAQFNPSKSENRLLNESDEPVVFLPMEKVSINGKLDCSEKKKYKDVCNGYSYFRKNDVVVAKITPCFENGKGAFLNELDTDFGFGTTEFITIRPSKYLLGEYLRLFLSSNWFLKIAENYMTGSAGQKRISSDFIANFKVGLPDANQQKEILYSLKSKTNNLDQMINRTEREISLIQEYRTRLIADVVTGKVDVRDIVVPETVEEDIIEAESTEDAIEPVEEEVAEPVE
jgi:type I restriction enzyme S subunit